MEELTRGEHIKRLVGAYNDRGELSSIYVAVRHNLRDVALDFLVSIKIEMSKSDIIHWYNLQFQTDFTKDEIEQLSLLY